MNETNAIESPVTVETTQRSGVGSGDLLGRQYCKCTDPFRETAVTSPIDTCETCKRCHKIIKDWD